MRGVKFITGYMFYDLAYSFSYRQQPPCKKMLQVLFWVYCKRPLLARITQPFYSVNLLLITHSNTVIFFTECLIFQDALENLFCQLRFLAGFEKTFGALKFKRLLRDYILGAGIDLFLYILIKK